MTTEHMSDAQLAAQPAAYWTGMAYEALIAFTRAQLVELGMSQPQYWLLRNLSKNDISPDGHGMTVPELQRAMSSYIRPEDDLEADSEVLLGRGWLTRDDEGRLWITDEGDEARAALHPRIPAIRDHIHQGVDDSDYVVALKVLRQMMRNVGSDMP
ncbi:MarR family transcriptional regulator [Streptomyces albireticuli]|uniref:MarR family transcriptional regulator n=1 Tax=Streptomyces albireticuli TaxID=1940 RepID=UPI0036ABAC4B